jgi:diphosphate-dependent phosphofructokinase
MMTIERRKGKDVPVIKKALVELDEDMFKSYELVRSKWAVLDCYLSPGPIQFKGEGSSAINFLVKPPNKEHLLELTLAQEKFEAEH